MKRFSYKEFEDKFRGPTELIIARQRIYLPLILTLNDLHDEVKALDLGCGRGEWLTIMKESGVEAEGIDLNPEMVAECRDKGLKVERQNANCKLAACEDGSLSIISAFHLVEHLQFDDLLILVKNALRVLRPGGLLIMETPNPENIIVGTSAFYTDPTHVKPIPWQLLKHLAEKIGFKTTKMVRLNGASEEAEFGIKMVFDGVSPDYAVVAQKKGEGPQLDQVLEVISKDVGTSLTDVIKNYDNALDVRLQNIDNVANIIKNNYKAAQRELGKVESELEILKTEVKKMQIELSQIYQSRSWKITEPLRRMKKAILKSVSARKKI